jgi:hypothetical protein
MRPWEGIHSNWATKIADQLNLGVLPPDYVAIPQVTVGGQIEVDVGAFQQEAASPGPNGATATAIWAPSKPQLVAVVDEIAQDVYEVQVLQEMGGPKLRAAIELVSPANKDRPASRRAFAIKCAGYLQRHVAVCIIDIVTERHANLHNEVVDLLGLAAELEWQSASGLYATAYRWTAGTDGDEVQVWADTLTIGSALPTLPLWLDAELCVPLQLDDSYKATCLSLRIAV